MSPSDGHRPVRRILAVDGGDSKTDVVLLDARGELLGARRLPISSHLGLDRVGAGDGLDSAIGQALRGFGIDPADRPVADVGVFCLAGADLPADERRIHRRLRASRWAARTLVRNDTLAILRAGTDRGWGIGIVCGSGMNAAGVASDGKAVRFAALGEISGDLAAGGGWIGLMALAYAVRAEDGRGEPTLLERLVPAYFKLSTPCAVTEAMYLGRLDQHRVVELAPLVFAAARKGDAVARGILDQVADEVVAFATSAIKRLRLSRSDVDVILGGGVFQARDEAFHDRIRRGIEAAAARASIRRLEVPPVVGAALIGLDELGAADAAVGLRPTIAPALLSQVARRGVELDQPAGLLALREKKRGSRPSSGGGSR